jgi:hypothetical protein
LEHSGGAGVVKDTESRFLVRGEFRFAPLGDRRFHVLAAHYVHRDRVAVLIDAELVNLALERE